MPALLRLCKFLTRATGFYMPLLQFFGASALTLHPPSGFYLTESSTSSCCYTPSIGSDTRKCGYSQRSCRAYEDFEGFGGVSARAGPAVPHPGLCPDRWTVRRGRPGSNRGHHSGRHRRREERADWRLADGDV